MSELEINKELDAESEKAADNAEETKSTENENIKNEEPEAIEAASEEKPPETTDYEVLAREDMRELIAMFPHLAGKTSVAELENPLRYAALRDLGLSPREAYLATSAPIHRYDNRSHLSGAVPRRAGSASDMLGAAELASARELFADLSDREIQKLYKKVSK